MRTTVFLVLTGLFTAGLTGAGEYLFNPKFELGSSGFALLRYLSPENNRKLEYLPVRVIRDESLPGKPVMHIRNPWKEFYKLSSKEFTVPAREELVFRGMMKSTNPDGEEFIVSLLSVDLNGRWVTLSRRINVNSEWKRYTVRLKNTGAARTFALRIIPVSARTGELKIADLSLSGQSRRFEPEFEIAVRPEKYAFVIPGDSSAPVTVHVKNLTGAPSDTPLKLTVLDQDGTAVFVREIPCSIAAGQVRILKAVLPLRRYGRFSVKPEIADRKIFAHSDAFAVFGKMDSRPFELRRDFCFGINGGLCLEKSPAFFQGASGGYMACSDMEEPMRLLSLAGCRIVRDHDGGIKLTEWNLLEPGNGRFDFAHFDRGIRLFGKYGIQILPCFGRMVENWASHQTPFRPEWLRPYLTPVAKNPPGVRKDFRVMLPPVDLWKRYVRAFAARAGKRISFYEVMNEPNLSVSAGNYVKYLKPAYEAIKEGNPDASVVGLCVTGDLNGNMLNFTQDAIRLGAANYFDIASFHPYDARELSSAASADRQIREMKKLLPGKPLWNTELYYLFDTDNKSDKVQALAAPHHAVRRFLTDSGEGVKQSISLAYTHVWKTSLNPHNTQWKERYMQLIPSDVLVACNAFARHFEGAVPAGKTNPAPGIVCYTFRRNGKPLAAVWNYLGKQGVKADLSPFEILDIFGNPVDGKTVALRERPFYLFPGKMPDTEFRNAIEKIRIKTEQPITVGALARGFGKNLLVAVQNDGTDTFDGYCRIEGNSAPVALRLAPGKQKTLRVRMAEDQTGKDRATVWIHGIGTGRAVPVSIQHAGTVLPGEPVIIQHDDGKLSARGTVSCRNGRLVIAFRVNDKTAAGPAGDRALWQTDSVELFLDFNPMRFPVRHSAAYTDDVIRAFIMPHNPEKERLIFWKGTDKNHLIPGTAFHSELLPDGYSFTLSLPVKELDFVGFDIKVNDAESPATEVVRSVSWSGRNNTHQNRFSFGIVPLTPSPETEKKQENLLPSAFSGLHEVSRKRRSCAGEVSLEKNTLYLLNWEARSAAGTILPLELKFQDNRRWFQKRLVGMEWSPFYAYFRTNEKETKTTIQFYFTDKESEGSIELRNIRLFPIRDPDLRNNLLPQETFESGAPTAGWMPVHYLKNRFPGELVSDPGAPAGERSMKLSPVKGRRPAITSPFLPAAPGKPYELTFWAKAEKPEQLLTASVPCWSPYGHKGGHFRGRKVFRLSGNGSWEFFSLKFKFPADSAAYPDLADGWAHIRFTGPQEQQGNIWIDHVILKQLP